VIGRWSRRRRERELDEEIRAHIRMDVEERVARGESRDEAERAARREFGSVDQVKHAARRVWGGMWLDRLRRDLSFALRQLRRSPEFAAIALTTIAVGIGLTTSVFSLVNALLFRPLPHVEAPDRLLALHTDEGDGPDVFSYMDYVDIAAESAAFEELAAFKGRSVDVSTPSGTMRVRGLMVSESYFRTLGVRPALGRFFTPDEDKVPGAVAVAVLSHALWRSSYGGREDVIGETITLNRRPFVIVGVAPEGFRGTNLVDAPELFVPMAMQPHLMPSSGLLLDRRGWGGIDVLGRLADGATTARAQAELDVMADRLREAYPRTNRDRHYALAPFRDATMPVGVRPEVLGFGAILMGLVALVLVIACVNVANLLLSRAHARHREVAVRRSLGATRGALVRQLLTEAGVLALVGGALGLAIALGMNRVLATIPLPFEITFAIDRNVLLFALAATVLTGLAFGLAPAIGTTRPQVIASLREAPPRSRRRFAIGPSEALVVVQVALSVAVLAAAGLLGRTLLNLRLLDPGYVSDGVITAELDPGLQGYTGARAKRFYEDVSEALRSHPATREVALSSRLPGPDSDRMSIRIRNHEPAEGQSLYMQVSVVSRSYFSTLGIPIRRGRPFGEDDREGSPPVLVVNEAGAELLRDLTGADPLDAEISIEGPAGPFMSVIGVAADVRSGPPREDPAPHLYFGFEQFPTDRDFGGLALLATGTGEVASLGPAVRSAVASVDPSVPVMSVRPLDAVLGDGTARERLVTTVLGIAAGLALLLASLGLYGVLARAVTRRTAEIGVRMALGAAAGSVLRSVLGRGLALTAAGLAVGLVLAALAGRALAALLYGVSARDVGTLAGVAAVLIAVAILASWVPARRATRIDPVAALRVE